MFIFKTLDINLFSVIVWQMTIGVSKCFLTKYLNLCQAK